MKLYHYTALEYIDRIMDQGLWKGDVPTTPTDGVNAVWLTTSASPERHGLSEGRNLRPAEARYLSSLTGRPASTADHFPNKKAIRITAEIHEPDPALARWITWAKQHVERQFLRQLNRTGAGRTGNEVTWYLYFGTLPPSRFVKVEIWDVGRREYVRFDR